MVAKYTPYCLYNHMSQKCRLVQKPYLQTTTMRAQYYKACPQKIPCHHANFHQLKGEKKKEANARMSDQYTRYMFSMDIFKKTFQGNNHSFS